MYLPYRCLTIGIDARTNSPNKWIDKSTISYDMVDFKSYIKHLTRKYLVTERPMLKLQGILLQYLKFN